MKKAPHAKKAGTMAGSALDTASGKFPVLYLLLVLFITALVFSGVSRLKWTNWDDDDYIYENRLVQEGDFAKIFNQPSANTYTPLVVSMFAVEWKLVKDKPLLYHLNNLALHLLCTALAFILFRKFGLSLFWTAFAALLFGIHPLRVESVAWITERKDVLYGFFYLSALWQYLLYLEKKKNVYLLFCFVLFALSLFSKIQAVTLAPVLLLVDWYKQRGFTARSLIEKIPFFLAALAIGIYGVSILREGNVVEEGGDHSFAERFVLGFYAYSVYLVKSLVPFETSAYYPQPLKPGLIHYSGMVLAFVSMAGAAILHRKKAWVTFGMGFFTLHIILLLQIVAAGSAFMADRFTYMAYIGLFLIIARMYQELALRSSAMKGMVLLLAVVQVVTAGLGSSRYVKAWKDPDTFWSDVIEKHPRKVVVAYVNRGHYLRRQQQNDRAFADFNTAIELKQDFFLGYLNRGNIYFDRNENEKAKQDYLRCLALKPGMDISGKKLNPEAGNIYGNLGAIYGKLGIHDSALYYLDIAMRVDPYTLSHVANRGLTYFSMEKYPESIRDFRTYLQAKPGDADIMNSVGINLLRLGKYEEARAELDKAIAIKPEVGVFYMNRAFVMANLGKKERALEDVKRAEQLGLTADPAFVNSLRVQNGSGQ